MSQILNYKKLRSRITMKNFTTGTESEFEYVTSAITAMQQPHKR